MIKGFIVGTGRSGTTLLVNLLGSHSQLSPLFELEFLVDLVNMAKTTGKMVPKELLGLLYAWGSARGGLPFKDAWDRKYDAVKPRFGSKYALFTKEELLGAGVRFLDDLKARPAEEAYARLMNTLADIHCLNDGKTHCIIKVPSLLRAPEIVFTALPQARYVHIYRDGRDVWCSSRNYWWGPRTLEDCAAWWAETLHISEMIRDAFPGRILEVKYEAMLTDPRARLDEIFAFLGLPPEPISYEFSKGSVGRHQKEMSGVEISRFNKIAGRHLENRGYTLV